MNDGRINSLTILNIGAQSTSLSYEEITDDFDRKKLIKKSNLTLVFVYLL